MERQLHYARWVEVETDNGTEWIPFNIIPKTCNPTAKDVETYIEGRFRSARLVDGYGARLSTSGYLDCTQWVVFECEDDARECLNQLADEGEA